MKPLNWFLAEFIVGLLVCVSGSTAVAQTSASKLVAINLVALDSTGHPVPDLTASDISVLDNHSRQKVVNLRLKQTDGPPALVVLFDLMNSSQVSRGAVTEELKKSLAKVPASVPLYVYLLVPDGSLYPVHALKSPATTAQGAPWQQNVGTLLDDATNNVNQLKPEEIRTLVAARSNASYQALESIRVKMTGLAGPKELLWMTYGFPSSIHYPGRGWFDSTPTLRKLGARFVQSGIAIYTADPGFNLVRDMLSRDSLDILSGATGGRTFSTIDLDQAISQVLADARSTYTIEYQPSQQNWDGKYHTLRVTSDRKGVRLRSQQGYFDVLGS
jgi:VWFA-related protein